MGVSTDAILAYGYALPEVDPEELDWVDEDEDGYFDFGTAVEERLVAAGIEGVHITTHCSVDYPMYLLTTYSRTSWRGDVGRVDAHEMVARPPAEGWDVKLDAAMTALGLTCDQERPSWLLCSDWG